jgi:GINS complex subunit 3
MLAVANMTDSNDESSKAFVELHQPAALSNDVISALKADARAVPLRDQSAYFFELATRMLDFEDPDQLSAVLQRTFVARAAEIALHARKAGWSAGRHSKAEEASNLGIGGAGEEFLRGLDEWERKLFRRGHDGTKAQEDWMDSIKKH